MSCTLSTCAVQVLRDMHVHSDAMVGVLTSVSLYGALLASGVLFFLGDRIGRKREMIGAAALCVTPSHTWRLYASFLSFPV